MKRGYMKKKINIVIVSLILIYIIFELTVDNSYLYAKYFYITFAIMIFISIILKIKNND